jgi:hypothetical protein
MPAPVKPAASKVIDRVPFGVAIADEKLLKGRFDTLSRPQQVILKAFYGLPLTEEELVFWSISQGGAEYDALGYVTKVTPVPYVAKEYDTLVLYVGRRSGKTDAVMSTAAAYELTLGGHTKYRRAGQELKVPFIAQTAGDAQKNMNFIKLALEESPLLRSELTDNPVASELRLKNGIVVDPLPATKSVGRGHGIPILLADETAFWYTDPNAANPDFEVFRAIQFAQAQFPNAKTFIGTTPWSEQGIAFKNFEAGTEGRKLKCDPCKLEKAPLCTHTLDDREEYEGILVIHASTAAMENPIISRKKLVQIRKRDPEAFPRESLAQTLISASAWLSQANIDRAIQPGRLSLAPVKGIDYVAALDPAFRNDSFAFTIVHHDAKVGIVQDYIQYWEPQPGEPLKPGVILDEIKATLDRYGLSSTYSDQYQLESLQQLASDRGFTINGYDFTGVSKSKICVGFKISLDQGRIELLDHELQKDQLLKLQRQVLQAGNIRIAAPPGKHDDLAMVLMLACRIVIWMKTDETGVKEAPKTLDNDHVKLGMEQIERKRREALLGDDD